MSSQYSFPIFISSTEYNLVDLRAELSRFLEELGYAPYVSSNEGFPSYTPKMTPWESCLKVLESSFLVILIIDGRYGARLDWKEYKDIVGDKISPTHGEYRMARHLKKKLLVFCRMDIEPTYQTYKSHLKAAGGDKKKAAEAMKDFLPPGMAIDTLDFYHEVKTSADIPWIKDFKNVVDIKKEIQSQLVNQLAISHMEKAQTLETVIAAFQTAVSALPAAKQTAVLKEVGLTKELLEELNERKDEAATLRAEIEKLNDQMQKERNKAKKEHIYLTANKLMGQLWDVNKQISFEKKDLYSRMDEANPKYIDLNSLSGSYNMLSGSDVSGSLSFLNEKDKLSKWAPAEPALWDGVLVKKQDDFILPTWLTPKSTISTLGNTIIPTSKSEQVQVFSNKPGPSPQIALKVADDANKEPKIKENSGINKSKKNAKDTEKAETRALKKSQKKSKKSGKKQGK